MALTLTASTVVASVKPTVSSNRRCVDVVRERISRFFFPDLFFIFCFVVVFEEENNDGGGKEKRAYA